MYLFFHKIAKSRALLLFITISFSLNMTVSAAMVTTLETMNSEHEQLENAVATQIVINREALEQKLVSFGVAPEQVHSRLNSMTDTEIATLSSEISELPAGGDVFTVLAVIFLVLLFTDIAGYTDLFPFVKKTARNSGSAQNDGAVIDRRETQKRREPIVVEN